MKFSIFFLLFCASNVFAQSSISIIYTRDIIGDVPRPAILPAGGNYFVGPPKKPFFRMVFNDSLGIVYQFLQNQDPIKRRKIVGDKLIHNATFFDLKNNKYYDEVNYPDKNKYLITEHPRFEKSWVFYDNTKVILGYSCKQALAVDNNNDSTMIWYTTELKFKRAGLFYNDVPGVVLEAYEQGDVTRHFIAAKIEETSKTLAFPVEGQIISRKEFLQPNPKTK
ncbi:MAG: GLPGLI family protein [Ferruginibacter sp.]